MCVHNSRLVQGESDWRGCLTGSSLWCHCPSSPGDWSSVGWAGLATENSGAGALFCPGRVSRRRSSNSRWSITKAHILSGAFSWQNKFERQTLLIKPFWFFEPHWQAKVHLWSHLFFFLLLNQESVKSKQYSIKSRWLLFQDQCTWKTDLPSILSVCLISLEPDSVLRPMHDQFTPGKQIGYAASFVKIC